MESPETPLIADEDIPLPERYVFYTTIEETDIRRFKLRDLQGRFITNHRFAPGDSVKLTVEKLDVHPDHGDKDQ